MAERGEQVDQENFEIVFRGIEKTFENAERLYQEAETLAKIGAIARALCLHQISLEECSKADSLGAWAISLFVGYKVDQNKVLKKMRSHEAKNKSNAYMLKASNAERDARARGDGKGAKAEFEKMQVEFHTKSNVAKNKSLYVEWINGEFISPSEMITTEMLADVRKRNFEFLGNTNAALKMLRRLKECPNDINGMQKLLTNFVTKLNVIRNETKDVTEEAIYSLFANFLQDAVGKLANMETEAQSKAERSKPA